VLPTLAYAANLSFLFTEQPFRARFAAAAAAGFRAVEFLFPYAHDRDEVRGAVTAHGLQVVLFNLPAGDWEAGDRGIAADPARRAEFRAGVMAARPWADALGCRRLNCLAGRRGDLATLVDNVGWAATTLARDGITVTVEAVNPLDVPGFVVPRADVAARVVAEVGLPNVRVQLDLYHEQRAAGNVTETLRRLAPQLGHVQVADCPGRHQPGTGELNFPFLLRALADAGYTGHVGLEYVPAPDTATSLRQLRQLGIGGDAR
jgi:hydroxypyruvate isomerase